MSSFDITALFQAHWSDDSDSTDAPNVVVDDDSCSNHSDHALFSSEISVEHPETIAPASFSYLMETQRSRPSAHEKSGRRPLSKRRNDSVRTLPASKQKGPSNNTQFSSIEKLPNEIIQQIAADVDGDNDLCNLNLSSPVFISTVNQDESAIWRTRFLAKYDHPIIDDSLDFSTAYKLRRLVLKNFISFFEGVSRRTEIQLEVLRDMILETYYNPKPWLAPPQISHNLQAMASPTISPWVIVFLSSSFPGITASRKYGEPNSFFETIQLAFSHLLLSPRSAQSHLATSSRENYDLFSVYNFNQPFTTIYKVSPQTESPQSPFRSSVFPNLKPSESISPPVEYKLDTNTLLHIRNFWHRHLIDDSHPVGEHTYADMMRDLARIGKTPKKWEQSLYSKIAIPTQWFGHYSCLHPWPKARKDLEERQSCAEDWKHVDPMMLQIVTSDDYADGFWPPCFSTIPAFDKTFPLPEAPLNQDTQLSNLNWHKQKSKSRQTKPEHFFPHPTDKPVYIRGIAPFVNVRDQTGDHTTPPNLSHLTSTLEQQKARGEFIKHHPFASLRIRGVIHAITPESTLDKACDAAEKAMPGWSRIVMVLYKHNLTHLVNVLEHAQEDYGGASGPQVTTQLNTANVWSAAAAATTTSSSTSNNPTTNPSTSTSTTTLPAQTPTNTVTPQIAPADLHNHYTAQLYNLLTGPTSPFPIPRSSPAGVNTYSEDTASKIQQLEDAFSPSQYLAWDDGTVDFAYAYEGAVLPGGKIMMGRWWRCHGLIGDGDGWEVGADGEGVVVGAEEELGGGGDGDEHAQGDGDDESEGGGDGNGRQQHGNRPLDRGPFVFWS